MLISKSGHCLEFSTQALPISLFSDIEYRKNLIRSLFFVVVEGSIVAKAI